MANKKFEQARSLIMEAVERNEKDKEEAEQKFELLKVEFEKVGGFPPVGELAPACPSPGAAQERLWQGDGLRPAQVARAAQADAHPLLLLVSAACRLGGQLLPGVTLPGSYWVWAFG